MPDEVVPSGTTVPFAYRISQWVWRSLDWLYPPVCAGCGAPNHRLCPDCRRAVRVIQDFYCEFCGIPLDLESIQICVDCKHHNLSFTAMRSWAIFDGPLRQAIHQLKYKRDLALGEVLALHLTHILFVEDWPIDLVVPVPLSRKRLASRGYNQADLLARPLALRLSLHYAPGALSRVKETATQIGLSPSERHRNVTNAFDADLGIVSDSTVLVVDDVITTGATMRACTQSLLDAGAKQVFAISVARAGNTSLL